MSNVLTLIADPRGDGIQDNTIAAVREVLGDGGEPDWLAPRVACDIAFGGDDPVAVQQAVGECLADVAVDAVAQPHAGRRKKLLVADMESTIIVNEMIDEIAAAAGVGDKVAAITHRVMHGELEFAAGLEQRVAMLEGLSLSVLDRACADIAVMPGARALVQTMRANGAYTALVSGGFTCFSARVRRAMGFHVDYANTLLDAKGRLTGGLRRPILDRAAKRRRLETLAAKRGLDPGDAMAVGDGANDLDMIAAAGMGVAFRAKPVVAATARARIDHGDLTALLYIQGYRIEDFRV